MTSLLLAAKANQPLKPSFALTVVLLPEGLQSQVSKADFLDLESKMLVRLEFDLSFASPIVFLERYERLFGLDSE